MYVIADQVSGWLAAGKPVTIVRVTQLRGIASRERAEVLAAVPGETWAGTLFAGALDHQLAQVLTESDAARTVQLDLAEDAAQEAGLSCGGTARLLMQSAAEFPRDTWSNLIAREPICLLTQLDGDRIGPTTLFTRADMDTAEYRSAVSSTPASAQPPSRTT